MSKKPNVLSKKATHVLNVSHDSHIVIAFDDDRTRRPLQEGSYQFFFGPNPCNVKMRALHLTGTWLGWYVSEHFLKNLDREFWKIVVLKYR